MRLSRVRNRISPSAETSCPRVGRMIVVSVGSVGIWAVGDLFVLFFTCRCRTLPGIWEKVAERHRQDADVHFFAA